MTKCIAMPNFGNAGAGTEAPPSQMPAITFYNVGPGGSVSPGRTISYASTNPVTSVNDVVVYQNGPAANNVYYMFVSSVFTSGAHSGSAGQIYVYGYKSLGDVASGPDPTPAIIPLQYPPVGMAVQPATGDLYVANYYGGVYVYTNSSGYTTGLQFSAFGPGGVCADLAFDKDGNLWLSSFNGDDPSTHLLTCYTQVGRAGGTPATDATQYIQFGNASAANFTAIAIPGITAPLSKYYPLAEPNGIAFDPNGNLWLANNDDDAPINGNSGNATLLRLSRQWIDQVLSTAVNNSVQTIIPGTAAKPGGTVYCVSTYAKFGSLYFDGFNLYVEDEANEVVELFNTTAITDQTLAPGGLTFPATPIAASYPGNGGLALFNTTPAKLLIRDGAWDGGGPETPPAGQFAFESPDIAASQQSILVTYPGLALGQAQSGSASTDGITLASQSIVGDNTAYIQVRVANYGGASDPASTGAEILKVQWAYASMGLGWPAPWDGEYLYSAGEFTGGLVAGAAVIPALQPGQEAIFEFTWNNVPNPQTYGNSGHFCLLARIEGNALYPFDMAYPEYISGFGETNVLAQNVMNNSTIAWRNITINPPPSIHRGGPGPHIFQFPVLGANYGLIAKNARFAIEMLDRDGAPSQLAGAVTVHAEGPVLERLLAAKLDETRCRYADGGIFHLHDHARGMTNIRLHPKEVFPFRLAFAPTHELRDFVVRVIQYADFDGREEVVGGQTFVVGQVRGYPTMERR